MSEPDSARLRAVVEALAADPFGGRRVGTDGARAAADHLASVLRDAGASVAFQDFPVNAAIREVYATPTMTWSDGGTRHDLAFRRDFCEHGASANRPTIVAGALAVADAEGGWILHRAYSHDGIRAAAASGAVGVLVPRGVDEAGWMPKMIAGSGSEQLPVLAVRRDLFDQLHTRVSSGEAVDVEASAPLRTVSAVGRNVLGTFRPHAGESTALLLTAHYDGVGDDPDGVRFPAAGDNASGVSAVIEAARILNRRLPPDVGLAVALLDAEEIGAFGSAAHAPTLAAGTHVINLDGAAALTVAHVEAGGPAEHLLRALDSAARLARVPLRARAMPSDNRRYAAAGLAAIGIGMGMPGYQTPMETPDRVETETLLSASQLLVGTALDLVAHRALTG